MQGDYRTEFGGFELGAGVSIPADWRDISWGNDACPSWQVAGAGVLVWIDWLDPADRDRGARSGRFAVVEDDDDPEQCAVLCESDDWREVLLMVALRSAERAMLAAADVLAAVQVEHETDEPYTWPVSWWGCGSLDEVEADLREWAELCGLWGGADERADGAA